MKRANILHYIMLISFFFLFHFLGAIQMFLVENSPFWFMLFNKFGTILFFIPVIVALVFGFMFGWRTWPEVTLCFLIVQIILLRIRMWDLDQGIEGGWRGYLSVPDWCWYALIMAAIVALLTVAGGLIRHRFYVRG